MSEEEPSMITLKSFESLEQLLREYRAWPPGPEGPFDVTGVAQLMRACLENLRQHHIEGDLPSISSVLDEDDRTFLRMVLDSQPLED